MSVKTALIFAFLGIIQFSSCQIHGIGKNNVGAGCNNGPTNMAFGNGISFGQGLINSNINGMPNFQGNFGSGNLAAGNIRGFSTGNSALNFGSLNNIASSGMTNSGYGDISLVGELPVGGTTAVAGNVPVIGYVTFEGILPADGLVTVVNNCNRNKNII